MKRVYFDNAATTPMDPEVLDAMLPFMREDFGNPSSTHTFGRKTKAGIETSRRIISKLINAEPGEILFTSGGTEADNMAIRCAVKDLGVKRIITSRIEHHAVLDTSICLEEGENIQLDFVKILPDGHVDLEHLELLLGQNIPTLVSLMHGNNEIGNLLPLHEVGSMCRKYGAYFHTDTVQTMGHYSFSVRELPVDFLTCGAHKFHGPKGVGYLFINKNIHLNPILTGGGQERKLRAGTENLYGIVGLGKAMEIAYRDLEEHQKHVQEVKSYMINKLIQEIPGVKFNGDITPEKSLYTVLSVSLPPSDKGEMLLFMLDINGVACSGGSACSSGSNKGSHVLGELNVSPDRANVRFSFSKNSTKEEVDYCVGKLKEIYNLQPVT